MQILVSRNVQVSGLTKMVKIPLFTVFALNNYLGAFLGWNPAALFAYARAAYQLYFLSKNSISYFYVTNQWDLSETHIRFEYLIESRRAHVATRSVTEIIFERIR